jgi:hypothetical protein
LKSIEQPQVKSIGDKHNWNRVFGYSKQLTSAHPGNLEARPRYKMLAKTLGRAHLAFLRILLFIELFLFTP